ncbi:YbaY family lipoprotein [Deinococcus navajonensis]|uniref:YbaY family lipoprotein n=1 Tax=Deinococcus navajonensis TaxID=309884 RepID=A0ABV8XQJ6_9DEIO
MKVFLAAALLTTLTTGALAQTRVGNILITPAKPAATQSAPSGRTTTGGAASSAVPAGMRELRGRVTLRGGGEMRLPAGSQVTVTVQEYGRLPVNPVVRVQFPATRLSAPYQVYFNPTRLTSGRRYAIGAVVTDRSGQVLYASDPVLALPQGMRVTLNLPVRRMP